MGDSMTGKNELWAPQHSHRRPEIVPDDLICTPKPETESDPKHALKAPSSCQKPHNEVTRKERRYSGTNAAIASGHLSTNASDRLGQNVPIDWLGRVPITPGRQTFVLVTRHRVRRKSYYRSGVTSISQ